LSYDSLSFILPLHLLSGLQRITMRGGCSDFRNNFSLPLAQAIAHSPEFSYLDVDGAMTCHREIPSLHDLLGNKSINRDLPLRHLSLKSWDVCLDKVPLSHFKF
jgi:hypothetical protein